MPRPDIPDRAEPIAGSLRITKRWYDFFFRASAPITTAAGALIWSTVGGVDAFRSIASLLLTGMVQQIVVGTAAVAAVNATAVYADTGLSATITPRLATSTILVLVFQNGCRKDTGNTSIQLKVLRGVTDIGQLADGAGDTGAADMNDIGTIAGAVSDAPGVDTAVTYKTQFASKAGLANARVQVNNVLSTMVLVEVAA